MTLVDLQESINSDGYKTAAFPTEKARGLISDLQRLIDEGNLNEYQEMLINRTIKKLAAIPAKRASMLMIAIPRGLRVADLNKRLDEITHETGVKFKKLSGMPLKRLAAQCGLARYGRNNITYIDGFGSCHNLNVFLTDLPCGEYTWLDRLKTAAQCEECVLCLKNCKSGAIRKDKFMIDSSICSRCFNCQRCCPMNNGLRM